MKKFHGVNCMGLLQKFSMWRKRGGVWKRQVHLWLPRLSWFLGGSYWHSYSMMSGVLANFELNSQTILPIWPTFPTRCDTDGFFHFSICCSNCLGWYCGQQRTSWIRKTITVFHCWKNFMRVIFAFTDNCENFSKRKFPDIQNTHFLYTVPSLIPFPHLFFIFNFYFF